MYCTVCREECDIVTIDIGVGYTEYGGAGSVDKCLVDASDCCEAEVVENLVVENLSEVE